VSAKRVTKKPEAVNREKDELTGNKNMKNLITFDSAELFFEKVPLNERCKQGAAPVQPMNRFK